MGDEEGYDLNSYIKNDDEKDTLHSHCKDILDLHGSKNINHAKSLLFQYLKKYLLCNHTEFKIIVGRGNHTNKDGTFGVIKRKLPKWINEHTLFQEFIQKITLLTLNLSDTSYHVHNPRGAYLLHFKVMTDNMRTQLSECKINSYEKLDFERNGKIERLQRLLGSYRFIPATGLSQSDDIKTINREVFERKREGLKKEIVRNHFKL